MSATHNESNCELMGTFGISIQILLGIVSFSILIIKRYREPLRRPWLIWAMDTSKQGLGACYLHILNIVFAEMFGNESESQCKWYFVNFTLDIGLGTLFNVVLLWSLQRLFSKNPYVRFETGNYGKTPSIKKWFYQMTIWILILSATKWLVVLIIYLSQNFLSPVADVLLLPFRISAELELLFVMILFPIILNSIQFWVQDNFLKENHPQAEQNYYLNPRDPLDERLLKSKHPEISIINFNEEDDTRPNSREDSFIKNSNL